MIVRSPPPSAVERGIKGAIFSSTPNLSFWSGVRLLANAFGGPQEGIFKLWPRGFVTDATSQVTASSAKNVAGIVDIQAVTTPRWTRGAVVADNLCVCRRYYQSPCAARHGTVSTLVERGRDGGARHPRWSLAEPARADPAGDYHPSPGGRASERRPCPGLREASATPAGHSRSGGAAPAGPVSRLLPGDCASPLTRLAPRAPAAPGVGLGRSTPGELRPMGRSQQQPGTTVPSRSYTLCIAGG